MRRARQVMACPIRTCAELTSFLRCPTLKQTQLERRQLHATLLLLIVRGPMPHLIIDCSDRLLAAHGSGGMLATVFDVARDSGLFAVQDIKVRIRPYADFVTGGSDDDFLHVFAYIMQGRTIEQRHEFSKAVVSALKKILPDVPVISMNVMEFEKATYNNRTTVA